MRFMGPVILVENMERSRFFYETVLRQRVVYDFGVNVSFEGGLAIHLKNHYQEVSRLGSSRGVVFGANNLYLNFETEELEHLHAELQRMNVEFLHEIQEQPWGQRCMRFYDPDMHIVEIGEGMEQVYVRLHHKGLSIEEIAGITAMPKENIEIVLAQES